MRLLIRADFAPLANRLGNLAATLDGDLSEVMGGIGGILESSTRRRFAETKTDPDGRPWEDLSDRTKAAKTNRSGRVRGSILVDTGLLLRSITHEAARDSVIVGSGMLYARYHQEGTAKMPARPFLGLSAQDYRDIDELLSDWIDGLI